MAPTPNQPGAASLDALRRMTPAAQVAVGLGALTLIVCASVTIPMVSAAFAPQLNAINIKEADPEGGARYVAIVDSYRAFVNGRSPFFPPSNPQDNNEPPPEPGRIQTGGKYTGPKLSGIFGEYAFFEKGVTTDHRKDLRVGERGTEITLVKILSPISVQVLWRGRHETLSLFEGGRVGLGGSGRSMVTPMFGSSSNGDVTLDFGGGNSTSGAALFQPSESTNRPRRGQPRNPPSQN